MNASNPMPSESHHEMTRTERESLQTCFIRECDKLSHFDLIKASCVAQKYRRMCGAKRNRDESQMHTIGGNTASTGARPAGISSLPSTTISRAQRCKVHYGWSERYYFTQQWRSIHKHSSAISDEQKCDAIAARFKARHVDVGSAAGEVGDCKWQSVFKRRRAVDLLPAAGCVDEGDEGDLPDVARFERHPGTCIRDFCTLSSSPPNLSAPLLQPRIITRQQTLTSSTQNTTKITRDKTSLILWKAEGEDVSSFCGSFPTSAKASADNHQLQFVSALFSRLGSRTIDSKIFDPDLAIENGVDVSAIAKVYQQALHQWSIGQGLPRSMHAIASISLGHQHGMSSMPNVKPVALGAGSRGAILKGFPAKTNAPPVPGGPSALPSSKGAHTSFQRSLNQHFNISKFQNAKDVRHASLAATSLRPHIEGRGADTMLPSLLLNVRDGEERNSRGRDCGNVVAISDAVLNVQDLIPPRDVPAGDMTKAEGDRLRRTRLITLSADVLIAAARAEISASAANLSKRRGSGSF